MSDGVGVVALVDFLSVSHDGNVDEDCWSFCEGGEGLVFFSDSKRSMNFWISGSVVEDVEVEVVAGGCVGVEAEGDSSLGVEGLSLLDEDHSQPMATSMCVDVK